MWRSSLGRIPVESSNQRRWRTPMNGWGQARPRRIIPPSTSETDLKPSTSQAQAPAQSRPPQGAQVSGVSAPMTGMSSSTDRRTVFAHNIVRSVRMISATNGRRLCNAGRRSRWHALAPPRAWPASFASFTRASNWPYPWNLKVRQRSPARLDALAPSLIIDLCC